MSRQLPRLIRKSFVTYRFNERVNIFTRRRVVVVMSARPIRGVAFFPSYPIAPVVRRQHESDDSSLPITHRINVRNVRIAPRENIINCLFSLKHGRRVKIIPRRERITRARPPYDAKKKSSRNYGGRTWPIYDYCHTTAPWPPHAQAEGWRR